jgi:hypothetical protein
MTPITKQMGEPSLPQEEPVNVTPPDAQKPQLATTASWILGSLLIAVVIFTTVSSIG